jgi:hemerythrin-like domain-containing protein
MKATDLLMQEHKLILRSLDVLDAISSLVESQEPVDQHDIDSILEFLRWLDAHHQGKEEDVLFPVIVSAAAAENRAVKHMTVEHNQERGLLEEMEKDLRQARHTKFVEGAKRLSSTLRNHIYKEDRILFESADAVLSPQQDQAVFERLNQFEKPQDKQTLEDRLKDLRALEWKYLRK